MAQELTGLEYLKKKEIKNMKCDMGKPFAFISYSHDDYDSQIVMNVFKQLMGKGHNLWIDTANMPTDEHTWKKSAMDALRNKNCKLAFFFRSESSMVKETISKELKTITILKHIKSIVVVDIWHEEDMDADTYYAEVMNDESKDIDSCDSICECVSTECNAIRLAGDAGNDILILVEKMEEELKTLDGIPTELSGSDAVIDDPNYNEEDEPDEDEIDDENDSDHEDEAQNGKEKKETVEVVSDGSIFHIKGRDGIYDAFYRKDVDRYTVLRGSKVRYSEKYTPKKIWEQNKNNITADGYLLCDIGDLVISAAAKLIEGTATNGKELDDPEKRMGANDFFSVTFDASKTVGEAGGTKVSNKKKSEFSDGYHYYIFGIEYHAGRREQANLMYDTFNALINKHPEKVMDIIKICTSVSKKDDVSNAGTRNAKPQYFRMCKEFTISGVEYVVGSSYGFEPKIAEIYRMIDACGEDKSIFELEGFEQKKKKDKTDSIRVRSEEEAQKTGFEYELWGITHTSKKMVDMLNAVFDLIAEKYPERILNIAESDKITAVARKADLDQGTANVSKIKQFSHYKGKEHPLNGDVYCVNAGYNLEGCIKQIEKMLILCDENPNVFKITKKPEKSTRSVSKSGKEGLGEILNQ